MAPGRTLNDQRLWNEGANFTSSDMQYGIKEEPTARLRYAQATGVDVFESGLWVNKRYPHLGATPDGITSGGGIIEIKCLKVLKENLDEDIARGMKVPRLDR